MSRGSATYTIIPHLPPSRFYYFWFAAVSILKEIVLQQHTKVQPLYLCPRHPHVFPSVNMYLVKDVCHISSICRPIYLEFPKEVNQPAYRLFLQKILRVAVFIYTQHEKSSDLIIAILADISVSWTNWYPSLLLSADRISGANVS
jgi:hypothetical protein